MSLLHRHKIKLISCDLWLRPPVKKATSTLIDLHRLSSLLQVVAKSRNSRDCLNIFRFKLIQNHFN